MEWLIRMENSALELSQLGESPSVVDGINEHQFDLGGISP